MLDTIYKQSDISVFASNALQKCLRDFPTSIALLKDAGTLASYSSVAIDDSTLLMELLKVLRVSHNTYIVKLVEEYDTFKLERLDPSPNANR